MPDRKPSAARFAPEQEPMWRAGLKVVLGALCIALVAYLLLRWAAPEAPKEKPVGFLDLIKVTLGIAAFVGATLTGVYAYRKQAVSEGDALRADAAQLAERYHNAADQLGHERPAARMAGVYAMARLADDWADERQACIEVLCAYLRLPYEHDSAKPDYVRGEREVRRTIVKLMRNHLRDPPTGESWCGYNFSFEGATFDWGDLSRARFTAPAKVSFHNARFVGEGTFHLSGTEFSGADVWFTGAHFGSRRVSFTDARFTAGRVDFTGARLMDSSHHWPGFEGAGLVEPGTEITWGDVPDPGLPKLPGAPGAS